MAVNQLARDSRPSRLLGGVQRLAYHLLSFETLLVLFIFGSKIKVLLPTIPIPETLFFGVLSLGVGGWILLRQGIYLRGIPIILTGLVFSGWMLISYGWSPSPVLARESLFFVLGINIWSIFAAACIVAESRERVLRFLFLIVVISIVISIYGTYIHFTHIDFRYYRGPNNDWNIFMYLGWGNIVAIGAAIALGVAIYTRFGSGKQLLAAAVFVLCMIFILVAGSRSAGLGALLAGLAAFAINMPRIRDGRIDVSPAQLLVLAAMAAAIGYLAYLLSIGETPSTVGRFFGLLDQAEDPLLRRGANRFDYYAGAYRAWLDAPLLGQGLQGFAAYFCGREDPGCFAHNVLLQSLAEFGLIGFVLYLAFIWSGLRHCRLGALRQDPLRMTLFMAFITVAMYAMVHANLPNDHRVFFFIGLLAMRPPPEPDEDEFGDAETPD